MSGPSALGTLLVQRLDAVLGVQMGAQASMVAGLRADAIVQPGSAVRPGQVEGEPSPQAQAAAIAARDATLGAVADSKLQTALQLANSNVRLVRQDTTPSAPTALGFTARTILALLAQFPEASPPLIGRAPLWTAGAEDGAVEGEGDAPGRPASASDAPRPAAAGAGNAAAGAGAANTAATPATPGNPANAALAGNAGNAAAGAQAADAAEGASATTALLGTADADAAPALRGNVSAQGAQATASTSASSPMAAQLGQGLRHAIQTSGLFYESHLADLLFGEKTVAQLRQEPQGRIVSPPPEHAAAHPASQTASQTAAAQGDAARGAQAANDMDNGAANLAGADAPKHATPSPSALAATAAAAADPNGLHPQTTLMVRQQLDVLAQQTINWRGEAWPDADMDWEIRRDPNGAADADQATWSTRLGLILPRLGEIEARISLSGNQVVLRIAAPASGAEIGDAAETLRARFGAAGLTLSNLAVQAHRDSAFGDGA